MSSNLANINKLITEISSIRKELARIRRRACVDKSITVRKAVRSTRSEYTNQLAQLTRGETITVKYKDQTITRNRTKFRKHLRSCASYVHRALVPGARYSIERVRGGVNVTRWM